MDKMKAASGYPTWLDCMVKLIKQTRATIVADGDLASPGFNIVLAFSSEANRKAVENRLKKEFSELDINPVSLEGTNGVHSSTTYKIFGSRVTLLVLGEQDDG